MKQKILHLAERNANARTVEETIKDHLFEHKDAPEQERGNKVIIIDVKTDGGDYSISTSLNMSTTEAIALLEYTKTFLITDMM